MKRAWREVGNALNICGPAARNKQIAASPEEKLPSGHPGPCRPNFK